MKKTSLFYFLLMTAYIVQAQFSPVSPEMFFNQYVPNSPDVGKICNSSTEEKNKFSDDMHKLKKAIDEQIAYLKKDEDKNAAIMEQQAKQQMATQYGLSAADMQKLQSGKLSKEDKKAMADKMMQQQTGLSMDEINDVKGYSKAGKEAWAQGYADQMKAESEKNPQKNQAQQANAKSLYEMIEERDALNKKLSAKKEKYGQKIKESEEDTSMIRLLREIDKLKAEYGQMVGVDYGQGAKMEQLASKIKSNKLIYCSKMTGIYCDVLQEYKESILKDFKDYYRLEELTNEINKQSSGSNVNLAAKGLMNYGNIDAYIGMLSAVYKYAIYNRDEPF